MGDHGLKSIKIFLDTARLAIRRSMKQPLGCLFLEWVKSLVGNFGNISSLYFVALLIAAAISTSISADFHSPKGHHHSSIR
jgi:hypothetical protein